MRSFSLFANGINVTTGCFSINSTCVAEQSDLHAAVTLNTDNYAYLSLSGQEITLLDPFSTSSAAYHFDSRLTATTTLPTITTLANLDLIQTTGFNGAGLITESNNGILWYTASTSGNTFLFKDGFVSSASSTVNGPFHAQGLFQASSTILAGGGTSTFYGGLITQGLQITSDDGAIESSSTGTSTFANGINVTAGCFSVNGACVSGGGGGVANPGTANRLAFYSAPTIIDSANILSIDTSNNLFDIDLPPGVVVSFPCP